jgi:putative acetyltransferase
MLIRAENPDDRAAIYDVNASAFETRAEAELVLALRDQADPVISLVAEVDGAVVGHIMFSPVALQGNADHPVMGLAPMAVAPEHQGRGVGSALVRAGLQRCREMGVGAVVVLGHPGYYPRFGFVPASRFGLHSEYDVPDEVFMALELQPGFLSSDRALVQYHAAFGSL